MIELPAHGLVLPSAFDDLSRESAWKLADADDLVIEAWKAAVVAVGVRVAAEYLRDRILELQLDEGGVPRRARPQISIKVRTRVMERCDWHCTRCLSQEDLVIDHVLPIARGGSSGEWNLTVLCGLCNARKGDRVA